MGLDVRKIIVLHTFSGSNFNLFADNLSEFLLILSILGNFYKRHYYLWASIMPTFVVRYVTPFGVKIVELER